MPESTDQVNKAEVREDFKGRQSYPVGTLEWFRVGNESAPVLVYGADGKPLIREHSQGLIQWVRAVEHADRWDAVEAWEESR